MRRIFRCRTAGTMTRPCSRWLPSPFKRTNMRLPLTRCLLSHPQNNFPASAGLSAVVAALHVLLRFEIFQIDLGSSPGCVAPNWLSHGTINIRDGLPFRCPRGSWETEGPSMVCANRRMIDLIRSQGEHARDMTTIATLKTNPHLEHRIGILEAFCKKHAAVTAAFGQDAFCAMFDGALMTKELRRSVLGGSPKSRGCCRRGRPAQPSAMSAPCESAESDRSSSAQQEQ